MSIDIATIYDLGLSHALELGVFDKVSGHEPKNAPGRGISAALTIGEFAAVGPASGLAAVSLRLELIFRIYMNTATEPQDAIDPAILSAADKVCAAYVGDFDFGGAVRNLDIFGQSGRPMGGKPGYVSIDGAMYRCLDLVIPVLINDVWNEVA